VLYYYLSKEKLEEKIKQLHAELEAATVPADICLLGIHIRLAEKLLLEK